jgi:hypothetical protein
VSDATLAASTFPKSEFLILKLTERIHPMRKLSRILVAIAVGALVAPALAGAAKTPGTHGVVVQRDAKAGALVVATRSGKLQRVHLANPNRIAMGTIVQVIGSRVAVVGHSHTAKLHGVVVRRHRHSFALAGNGSVLAVTSPTPPTPGEQVTATVQVSATSLSDDNGDEQVNGGQVASAEVRGTFLSADATTLHLNVPGFPSGLAILLGGQTLPAIAVNTPVEARVALGPDPANPSNIVLTLVSLRVEGSGGQNNDNGSFVKAEGKVTAITEAGPLGSTPGSITVEGQEGTLTFVIPAGFGATGVAVGDDVEAFGTPGATPADQPTLVKLEASGNGDNGQSDNGSQNNGGEGGDSGNSGSGSGGND